jgi:hypothetical protein
MMLERIPEPYSQDAADAHNRLRLLKADLRVLELAIEGLPADDEERESIVLMLRRMIGDTDELAMTSWSATRSVANIHSHKTHRPGERNDPPDRHFKARRTPCQALPSIGLSRFPR